MVTHSKASAPHYLRDPFSNFRHLSKGTQRQLHKAMEIPEEIKLFLLESYENLDKVEQDLLTLEKDPSNAALLNSVFRCIHTIKGNSGFLGFSTLEAVCHKGEAVLDKLRSGALTFNEGLNSDLLGFIDFVRLELQGVESSGQDPHLASEATLLCLTKYLK